MKVFHRLLDWGFCNNRWAWFHCLAGGTVAKVANIWLPDLISILIVLLIAIIWEVIEFLVECRGSLDVVKATYGSMERWVYDSIGDIILAVACAVLVLIGRL